MFQDLWPNLPVWEVPITHVTNGIHLPAWLNGELARVYDQYLIPDWRERYPEEKTWDLVDEIPDNELWEAHKRRKRNLTLFVRERALASARQRSASGAELARMSEVLEPDRLTIGFARRFATYKRATLLFRDPERLKRILTNPERPVQIVIAGKAHPKDMPGKSLISQIVHFSRDPALAGHIIFLEDYGMQVAREMVQGVDVWLNNPRRGEEACGTSGMKAAMNGVLNLSILDGWFDEAFETSGGWAIGGREPYHPDQDEAHARTIYSILENEVATQYYDRDDEGVPVGWVRRMKLSLRGISAQFSAWRMVGEYMSQLYGPAHEANLRMRANGYEPARKRVQWNEQIRSVWDRVRFLEVGPGPEGSVLTGARVPVRTVVDLAGLSPSDVRVEAVVGRVGSSGALENAQVMTLESAAQLGQAYEFVKQFVPEQTGRLGYSLRISPNHYEDPLTRPCNSLLRWGSY
jgi:starch phosphorylase